MATASERELPLIQRSIIDNCFEEGQYEYGIDVLDKLRGEGYKPSPLHMRQLLYIALYPPPPKLHDVTSCNDGVPSPKKVEFQRQKQDLWPKPTSRPLAISLLQAFVGTNSPECLMRGLPFYSYVNNEDAKDVDPFYEEKQQVEDVEDSSPIKDGVLAIQSLKDCWGLLSEGFVKRKHLEADASESDHLEDAIVGPYAWPILEWLICTFEKEERRGRGDQSHHSALLLCQIPQPRTRKGPRWDAEVPLQVVSACFSSISRNVDPSDRYSAKKRLDLGVRLISLLVNLTLTRPPLLSPSHFLRSLTLRLPNFSLPSLQALFSGFSISQTPFKISLLESSLSTSRLFEGCGTSKPKTSRPRAKPRFTGKEDNPREDSSDIVASTNTQDQDAYPMSSRSDLLGIISSPLNLASMVDAHEPSSFSLLKISLAKFHLLSGLYVHHLSHKFSDEQWNAAVREGRLRETVLAGFKSNSHAYTGSDMIVDGVAENVSEKKEVMHYMTSSLEIVKIWEMSLTQT